MPPVCTPLSDFYCVQGQRIEVSRSSSRKLQGIFLSFSSMDLQQRASDFASLCAGIAFQKPFPCLCFSINMLTLLRSTAWGIHIANLEGPTKDVSV